MRDRAQRRFDEQNKYKKRLKTWASFVNLWDMGKPKTWTELKEHSWSKFLKNTPKPCSCYMCRGEEYNRTKHKQEQRRIINEELNKGFSLEELDYWEQEDYYHDMNEYYRGMYNV